MAAGADLEPGTVLAGYRAGLFPMGLGERGADPLGWWSPDPRGVLGPGDLRVSRSVRRSARDFRTSVDTAFDEVVQGCADPSRAGGWISPEMARAMSTLHRLGWAHSVEVWSGTHLVGGLYGLGLGGLFAGESMFHRVSDASKVALWALIDRWGRAGTDPWLVDVQWCTDHLASLGAREIGRSEYLAVLAGLVSQPNRDLHGPRVGPLSSRGPSDDRGPAGR